MSWELFSFPWQWGSADLSKAAVCLVFCGWMVLEYRVLRMRGAKDAWEFDRFSLSIMLSIFLLMILSGGIVVFLKRPPGEIAGYPVWLGWAGIMLAVAGIYYRQRAVAVLGRFFTPVVQVQPGHCLVRDGPYRHVRHPSYAGLMLSITGMALALGNLFLLVFFPSLAVIPLAYRIRVEEKALLSCLGEEYQSYRRKTKCFIPYVY